MAGGIGYRNAFVTGASSGLGAAFARMLRREGLEVWGSSRDCARLASLAGVHPVALELADRASIRAAWAQVEEESGGIDLLINNAGFGCFGRFSELPEAQWENQIEAVFMGAARLARLAAGSMPVRGGGAIVNVSSLVVEFPMPFLSAYNAAKAALAALSATLEAEMGGQGVIVIDFRPGDFRTAFNDSMRKHGNQIEAKDEALVRAWARCEQTLQAAPPPEVAAADLRRALLRGRSGVVRSGSFFQARLAPFLNRFASHRLSRFLQRRYFHIG